MNFEQLLASAWGRFLLAIVMTAITLGSLYLGKANTKYGPIDADGAPNSFGYAVIGEAIVAAGLWIAWLVKILP